MIQIAILLVMSAQQERKAWVPVTLDGDARPKTIIQSFEASCGGKVVRVELRTMTNRSNLLTRVSIDKRDALQSVEIRAAQDFLKTVRFPSLSAVQCPAGGISFGIMGGPLSGGPNFYRVTVPFDRR